jgi:hypothetical protein
MNSSSRRYSKCISVLLLSGAFVISSEMPLLASSQEQSSSSETQRTDNSLPDAPQSQPAQTSQAQESTQVPSGTAGAKAPNVKGAPVAQPSGAAVAPPRQHGHRSLLIKLGILAGAGIAVGTVVALSQASPARPPGASASTHP